MNIKRMLLGSVFAGLSSVVVLAAGLAATPNTAMAAIAAAVDAVPRWEPLSVGPDTVPPDAQGRYSMLVRFNEAPVATYRGGLPGLAATNPRARGETRLDPDAPASRAYRAFLESRQAQHLAAIGARLGRELAAERQFLLVLNGAQVRMTLAEAEALRGLDFVKSVHLEEVAYPTTDVGPAWIGAPAFWNGDSASGIENRGEGVVIGIIDSGFNHGHPSFAEVSPGDGYVHVNPNGPGVFLGVCDPAHPNHQPLCNDKTIGAYSFHPSTTDPNDTTSGHGSHVAGTAAGNPVDATIAGLTLPISGVAPRANLINYRVCFPTCPQLSSVAAVEQGITDGVHVLNYSISGSDNPWNNIVDLAFLDAFEAGIYVSASAGNDGPGASTVAKTGPWNASVGNSTHNRVIGKRVDAAGLLNLHAIPSSGGPQVTSDLTADLLDLADVVPSNPLGCNAGGGIPGGSLTGAIVLIQRGDCPFAEKINNAAAAGAVAVLMFNNAGGPPIVMGGVEATTIPGVMLDLVEGLEVRAAAGAGSEATLYAATSVATRDRWGDVMAQGSSRGPSQFNVLKPDFIAPGTNVLAADIVSAGNFGLKSGTSMASPHGAGAAALLIAEHPTWSPAQVKSALALSAKSTGILNHDGINPATPFARGSGRINLAAAAHISLVMDETHANFVAANPGTGGDPRTLNLPSMQDWNCVGTCSWTRTVTSVAADPVNYQVQTSAPAGVTLSVVPSTFSLAPGASQELTITANTSAAPPGQWYFGEVRLVDADSTVTHINESFTGTDFPPTGWTRFNVDGGGTQWARSTTSPATAPAAATHGFSTAGMQDGWLVTPPVALANQASLRFAERTAFPADFFRHTVLVSTGSCNPADGDFVELVQPGNGGNVWRTLTFSLAAFDNQTACVAFRYEGNDADSWFIDDVVITSQAGLPTLSMPVAAFAINPAPVIEVAPAALSVTQPRDQVDTRTLTIGNSGGVPLDWTIDEAVSTAASTFRVRSDFHAPQGGDRAAGPMEDGKPADRVVLPSGGIAPVPALVEGFEDISLLPAAGWAIVNNSSPAGSATWFQGSSAAFPAHRGPANSFIAVNFNSGSGLATLSNWLITPEVELFNGLELRFWTRRPDQNFEDRLQVRLSTAGPSTDVGTTATSVGDFTELLLDINPTYAANGYPRVWTEFTVTVSGLPEPTTGRFAFRYFVENGGPSGANSNFIGIDSVSIGGCNNPTDIPWLAVAPAAGTTAPGANSQVTVTIDTNGLSAGSYSAQLCVASNDPANPLVSVPVALEVPPVARIALSPTAFDVTLDTGDADSRSLTIGNIGDGELLWSIETAEAQSATAPFGAPELLLWDNGPLVSHPGAGPGGTDHSVLQNNTLGMTSFGFGAAATQRFAEDFTVTDPDGWRLERMRVYAYQTNSTSSPFVGATLRIWDGPPNAPGSTVVFGDTTTNRFLATGFSGSYRVSETTVNTARANWFVDIAVGTVLPAGAYWVDWSLTASPAGGFAAPITIPGQATTGNALHFTSGAWTALLMGGTNTPQGMPFLLYGNSASNCVTPTAIPWLSASPASGAVDPDDEQVVSIGFDADGLAPGVYEAQLCVFSNDPDAERSSIAVTLTVEGEPEIEVMPETLSDGTVGEAYSATFTASGLGSTPPFTFAVSAGSLPPGLVLDASGDLSGEPTAAGSFDFTITATDSTPAPGPYSGSRAYTLVVAQGSQTISFAALPNRLLDDSPFTVSATASSGLPVSFASLTTGVCQVSGTSVTLLDVGVCTLRASQPGNADYLPAPDVDRSFLVLEEEIFADGFEEEDLDLIELEGEGSKQISLPLVDRLATLAPGRAHRLALLQLEGETIGILLGRCIQGHCEVALRSLHGETWADSDWWSVDREPFELQLEVVLGQIAAVRPVGG
jgi:subtilisin family serine protease